MPVSDILLTGNKIVWKCLVASSEIRHFRIHAIKVLFTQSTPPVNTAVAELSEIAYIQLFNWFLIANRDQSLKFRIEISDLRMDSETLTRTA